MIVKISAVLTLSLLLTIAGCRVSSPRLTDDTLVTNQVDGVQLLHRHIVQPPVIFKPLNQRWRALYRASVMTTPDFSGKVVRYLKNGQSLVILGEVENQWLAVADLSTTDQQEPQQLIGYIQHKAAVPEARYEATLRSGRLGTKNKKARRVCINVGGTSKACQNRHSATWILE